jgi:hypothetical protein
MNWLWVSHVLARSRGGPWSSDCRGFGGFSPGIRSSHRADWDDIRVKELVQDRLCLMT